MLRTFLKWNCVSGKDHLLNEQDCPLGEGVKWCSPLVHSWLHPHIKNLDLDVDPLSTPGWFGKLKSLIIGIRVQFPSLLSQMGHRAEMHVCLSQNVVLYSKRRLLRDTPTTKAILLQVDSLLSLSCYVLLCLPLCVPLSHCVPVTLLCF